MSCFYKSFRGVRFPITSGFWSIWEEWANMYANKDGFLSGVCADWIEDNIDMLKELNSSALTDLYDLISYFRQRQNQPYHNRVG